jgi:predicted permease
VAVVGVAFARRRFGGADAAVGAPLPFVDGTATVIGVMPEWFQFPLGGGVPGRNAEPGADMWIPLAPQPGAPLRGRLRVIARLADGVSIDAARSELAMVAQRIPRPAGVAGPPPGVRLSELSEAVIAPQVRRSLFLLFAAAGLVLIIACGNVAGLSLVRRMRRTRELAIRNALGASRFRLASTLVAESLVISGLGGIAALALARWSLPPVLSAIGGRLPRAFDVGLHWPVLAIVFGVCAAAGVVVGLVSSTIVPRAAQALLKESGDRGTMSRGPSRLRDGLVVLQVMVACVLTLGAVLLARELVRLQRTDPGMATRNAITFHLGQPLAGANVREFYDIEARVSRLPGVRAAGLTQFIPLQHSNWTSSSADFLVHGSAPSDGPPFPIELRYVSPGYFETLGIPIRLGRAFTSADTAEATRVIAINETLATRYFADRDPIGRETNRGFIAAVVGDVRQVHLDRAASPEIYFPIAQNWSQTAEAGTSLVVSVHGPPEAVADPVRAVVRDVNPRLAIFDVMTLDEIVEASLLDFRLFLWLLLAFAALALALSAIGTYGVIAHLAQARTREWGIRIALGADRGRVAALVLAPAARLVALGLGAGLAAAFAAAPLLRGLPVAVRPPDAATAGVAAAFVGILALAACLAPARRACAADPAVVLREE